MSLGIIGRQSIKSTVYIYCGVLVGFVLRAQLFPKFLTASEIGILALLVSYSSIYAQIAILGFNHGTIKYFPYFRNRSEGHQGFLSLYLSVSLVGFIIFLVVQYLVAQFTFSAGTEDLFQQYYYLCIPMTAGLLMFMVFDNYNTVLYNATTGILLRDFVLRVIMLAFLALLIWELIDFDTYAYLYVGSFVLIALMLMGFVMWRGEFHLKTTPKLWDHKLLKKIAGISTFGFLTGLNTVIILQVNNILIDRYYDEALTGIYVTNFFFAALILLPAKGLNKIAPTIIADAFKTNDLKTVHSVQYKSTINQLLIGLLLFVGLYINSHNIYRILPESYAIGYWVIVITGLANVVQMLGGVSTSIIGFSNYYRYNTLLSVVQLVALVMINLLLLPSLGITGAAWATFGAILILNVTKFIILKSKFNIQPYSSKHLIVLVVGALCIGINYFIPVLVNLVGDIIIRSVAITVIFVGLTYFLKISRDMNTAVNKTIQKLKIW